MLKTARRSHFIKKDFKNPAPTSPSSSQPVPGKVGGRAGLKAMELCYFCGDRQLREGTG